MPSRLVALAWDADDPAALARFWAVALGWDVDDTELVPTDHTPFRIRFVPSSEPKGAKNPIHLDLTTSSLEDQEETVRRLVELGAKHADVGQAPEDLHVVLADPEGNEFCVIEPTNNFLATCERLGSITCDGSPTNGRFWSAALGWPLVWDQDEETAIRAPDDTGPFITWGPPVPPKPPANRLRLVIDPGAGTDHLVALGATRVGDNVMADPDGNQFVLGKQTAV